LIDPATAVSVGRILASHGVRGELKVEPLTDFPERFRRGARVWLRGEPIRIEASRWLGRSVLLKLEGIDDRSAADGLRGQELLLPQPKTLPDAGVFYQHDIVGLSVETAAGEALGKVESIFSTGANDVFVVRGEQGELLLPAIEDVVRQIDLSKRRIVVELLPGLEFTPASKPPRRPTRRRPASTARRPSVDASEKQGQ
jgi:16S rRNA processing protein RimM